MKNLKKYVLSFLLISMAVTTVLQRDIGELKANQNAYESLLPEISGEPKIWTNKMVQLTINQNDTDYLYSFSDKEDYYNWQKENISSPYGQNTTVYVAVMDQSGAISKKKEK